MLVPVIEATNLSKKADEITLHDVTGNYNAVNNPGGYGTPNADTPDIIGLVWKYWPDSNPYKNFTTDTAGTINDLLSNTGRIFTALSNGLEKYKDGIHQIKYYPFEQVDAVASVTHGSATITITSGSFNPTTMNSGYIGVCITNNAGGILSEVLYIGTGSTSNTLILSTPWTAATTANCKLFLAPEADTKFLVSYDAESCIAKKVGKIAQMVCCDDAVLNKLMKLTMWKFSAEIKAQCSDFQGAHDLVIAAKRECEHCISDDCKICK